MATASTNFGFSLPAVNSATDEDIWGDELNANSTELDGLLLTTLNWTAASRTANFSVTARTAASSATGSSKIIYLCDATSGAITAALPPVATCSGLAVAIKKVDSSANTVTLDGDTSEVIDGATTQVLSARYACMVIQSDGTQWNIIATLATLSPRYTFSAQKAGIAQTGIPTGMATKLTFATEDWDFGGFYDTTNSKVLPTVAGKWRISAAASLAGGAVDQSEYRLMIYKNGVLYKQNTNIYAGGGAEGGIDVTALIDFNGTTDFAEIFFVAFGAGDKTVTGNPAQTYFQAEAI